MKRILILSLMLWLSLELSNFQAESQCTLATPEKPEDCYSLVPSTQVQTCCFFIGSYNDGDGYKTGKRCLEANRSDVNTGEHKAETQKKIEAGTYWSNYPPIKDIQSFSCFTKISECERIQPAKDENSCFSAYPELNNQVCCYLESDWTQYGRTETDLKYCLDIDAVDVETEEKKEITKQKIINSTYWDGDYGHPNKIDKLVCKNPSSSSSSSLMINLLVVALILLLF